MKRERLGKRRSNDIKKGEEVKEEDKEEEGDDEDDGIDNDENDENKEEESQIMLKEYDLAHGGERGRFKTK